MAKVSITPVRLNMNEFKALTFTAGATDGILVDASWADNKRVILLQNTGSGAGTAVVKSGNGYAGVKDLDSYSIAASEICAIRIDDAWFKNVSGDDKGKVLIVPSAATIKCSVVELP